MPRNVTYKIEDQPDGRFSVIAVLDPERSYRRSDFATLADAEDWVDGLRMLMAACGAPVAAAPSESVPLRTRVSASEVADATTPRAGTAQD